MFLSLRFAVSLIDLYVYIYIYIYTIGRSNFDKDLHNSIKLIPKRHKKMTLLYCKMESIVDSNEKKHY